MGVQHVGHTAQQTPKKTTGRQLVDISSPGYEPKPASFKPWNYMPQGPIVDSAKDGGWKGALVGLGVGIIGSAAAVHAGQNQIGLRAIPQGRTSLGIVGGAIALGALAGAVLLTMRRPGGGTPPDVHTHESQSTLEKFTQPTGAAIAKDGQNPRAGTAMSSSLLTPDTHPRANNSYVKKKGDLLPDITPVAPQEISITGLGRNRKLMFSATWPNVGQGQLEIQFDANTGRNTKQRIHTRYGTTRTVNSEMQAVQDVDKSHDHVHMYDMATFELFKAKPDGTAGARVAAGNKVSFLITDVDNIAPGFDPNGHHRVNYDSPSGTKVQGMSVAWGDTYGAYLDGQSLDIGNLAAGKYILRQTFDPADRLAEASDTNNSYNSLLTIRANNNTLTVDPLGAPRLPKPGGGRRNDEIADNARLKQGADEQANAG